MNKKDTNLALNGTILLIVLYFIVGPDHLDYVFFSF